MEPGSLLLSESGGATEVKTPDGFGNSGEEHLVRLDGRGITEKVILKTPTAPRKLGDSAAYPASMVELGEREVTVITAVKTTSSMNSVCHAVRSHLSRPPSADEGLKSRVCFHFAVSGHFANAEVDGMS